MAEQKRVVVVTGASSGLGKEAAKALAAQGWRVIGIGRNAARTEAAGSEIRAAAQGGPVDMLRADLALLSEARRVGSKIAALTDRVDVLLNNAGGMAHEKVITAEGFEENFASNHLGPFVLTNLLLPLLRKAAQGAPAGSVRIINTSSDASEMIPGVNWNDLQNLQKYSFGAAYCTGKLANVLFAHELARRLADQNIVAHSVHPGTVMSNFFEHAPESTLAYIKTQTQLTPEQAAEALVWLATAPEPGQSSGKYFHQKTEHAANPIVTDENAARLWAESERLIATAAA